MKMLTPEVTSLLDKLYNLRSPESYILLEMERQKNIAEETKEKTLKEKEELQDKISNLKNEESILAEQGANLRDLLNRINPEDYSMVLNRLNINFNPVELKDKVDNLLPGTIEEVVNATKEAEDKLLKVEDEMNSAVTTIDELAIRKDTELSNQAKLNEYFDLALSGNINITRDAITSLISQFDFNEEEQREVAKIMMFPEDALYEYDEKIQRENNKGISISDVLIEAKESVSTPIGDIFTNKSDDNFSFESTENNLNEESDNEVKISDEEPQELSISELLNNSLNDDSLINDIEVEEINNFVDEEKLPEVTFEEETESEEVNLNNNIEDEESMMELFKRIGLSEIMFAESELSDLINLEDKKLVEKNVNILNNYKINLDVLSDNVNLLKDPELEEKINLILNNGKSVDDIYFNPSVLKKYDAKGLESAILLLKENGLNPEKVPLMAY